MEKLILFSAEMGLSKEEIKHAIPVKEPNILCLCGVVDGLTIKTPVKLERIGISTAKGTIVGAIGKCPNCSKVYYYNSELGRFTGHSISESDFISQVLKVLAL